MRGKKRNPITRAAPRKAQGIPDIPVPMPSVRLQLVHNYVTHKTPVRLYSAGNKQLDSLIEEYGINSNDSFIHNNKIEDRITVIVMCPGRAVEEFTKKINHIFTYFFRGDEEVNQMSSDEKKAYVQAFETKA